MSSLATGYSEIFSSGWSDPAMVELFSDGKMVARWLRALAALAEAQSEAGLIPASSAAEIARHCRPELFPAARLDAAYRATGHSTAGLIALFTEQAPKAAADFFYFGATVQDVTDTANAMAFKEALSVLDTKAARAEELLTGLAVRHRATPMLGRTHGQYGSLITFGFKCAAALAELRRQRSRLRRALLEVSHVQLGGAVGGLTSMGERALEIRAALARKLGIADSPVSWTSSRDNVQNLLYACALTAGTVARFGNEIYNLQRSGIEEVREGQSAAQINSISMPHKSNPEQSEQLGSLAAVIRQLADCDHGAHEHERDGRAWKLEWVTVPRALNLLSAQLSLFSGVLERLEVRADRMRANIEATLGHCHSDALQFTVAARIGLSAARALMNDIYRAPGALQQPLMPAAVSRLEGKVSPAEISSAFDVAANISNSVKMCDAVIKDVTGDKRT